MSFDYTSYVAYGFKALLNKKSLAILQEHFGVTAGENLYYENSKEYMKEEMYGLLELPITGVRIDIYDCEFADTDDMWILVTLPNVGWEFEKHDWNTLTPTYLTPQDVTATFTSLHEKFGTPPVGWMVYSTIM